MGSPGARVNLAAAVFVSCSQPIEQRQAKEKLASAVVGFPTAEADVFNPLVPGLFHAVSCESRSRFEGANERAQGNSPGIIGDCAGAERLAGNTFIAGWLAAAARKLE